MLRMQEEMYNIYIKDVDVDINGRNILTLIDLAHEFDEFDDFGYF